MRKVKNITGEIPLPYHLMDTFYMILQLYIFVDQRCQQYKRLKNTDKNAIIIIKLDIYNHFA